MPQKSDEYSQFMTSEEVAKLLRIPIGSLLKLTSKRQIPHIKVGRRLRFDRTELFEWIRMNRIPTE